MCKIFTLNCSISLLELEENVKRICLSRLRNFCLFALRASIHSKHRKKFQNTGHDNVHGGEHHIKERKKKDEKNTRRFKEDSN